MASLSPERVGRTFAKFYYSTYPLAPAVVSGFYQDGTKLSPPEKGAFLDAVNEKMYISGKFKAEIISVDTEPSHNGGVVVVVVGRIVEEQKNRRRSFTQTFFLAPKGPHYVVCNDIFKYVDDDPSQVPVESAATIKAHNAAYAEMFDLTMGVIRERGAFKLAKLNKSILQKQQQQKLSSDISAEEGSAAKWTEPTTKTYASTLKATAPVPASASFESTLNNELIKGLGTTKLMD